MTSLISKQAQEDMFKFGYDLVYKEYKLNPNITPYEISVRACSGGKSIHWFNGFHKACKEIFKEGYF